MTQRTFPAKQLAADVKEGRDNWSLMQEYQVTYPQLVFLFAGLASKGMIKTSIVTSAVEALVEVGQLDSAQKIFSTLEAKYPQIRGMKSLRDRLESAAKMKYEMEEYYQQLSTPSAALEEFSRAYPGIVLHPEIRRLIPLYEMSAQKQQDEGPGVTRNLLGVSLRLKAYAENESAFRGLSSSEANRMWHVLALRLFADRGIKSYVVNCQMSPLSCPVCVYIASQDFSIQPVMNRVEKDIAEGALIPKRLPSFPKIHMMDSEKLKRYLMKGGWYLPPFCDDCRCQIFPFLA